jgi:hypothetical protein
VSRGDGQRMVFLNEEHLKKQQQRGTFIKNIKCKTSVFQPEPFVILTLVIAKWSLIRLVAC